MPRGKPGLGFFFGNFIFWWRTVFFLRGLVWVELGKEGQIAFFTFTLVPVRYIVFALALGLRPSGLLDMLGRS
jgi:hypothetical protein